MALIATAETTETGISIWDAGSTVVSEESVWKRPVRAASTANVADPLTAAPATIDGVTLADGDRILLKDQSTALTNGIYRRVSASVWERASDYEAGAVVEAGVKVYVQEGTTHAKQTFRLASPTTAITVGSTPTTWENDAAVQTADAAGGAIAITGTEGETSTLMTLTGTVDEARTLISLTSGNHTTTTAGDLLAITGDAEHSGDLIALENSGTGGALDINPTGTATTTPQIDITFSGGIFTGTPTGINIDQSGISHDNASPMIGIDLTGNTGDSAGSIGLDISGYDTGVRLSGFGDQAFLINGGGIFQGGDVRWNDNVKAVFGTNTNWSLQYEEFASDKLEWTANQQSTSNAAGYGYSVQGGFGGNTSTTSQAGSGALIEIIGGQGGFGAASTTGLGGVGGGVDVTGGIGGTGSDTGPSNAGAGGTVAVTGGRGGTGGPASSLGGDGGNVTIDAGAAGVDAGAGTGSPGTITIGGTNTTATDIQVSGGVNTEILTLTQTTGQTMGIYAGTASPDGSVSADPGSVFLRDDGSSLGQVWVCNGDGAGSAGTSWSLLTSTNGWASETVTTSSSASSAEFDMFDQTNYGGTPPTTNVTREQRHLHPGRWAVHRGRGRDLQARSRGLPDDFGYCRGQLEGPGQRVAGLDRRTSGEQQRGPRGAHHFAYPHPVGGRLRGVHGRQRHRVYCHHRRRNHCQHPEDRVAG
jgi:hypothetical protein